MSYTYTVTSGDGVLRSDGAFVPKDPANMDWVAYEAWIAAGNTAAPAPVPVAAHPTVVSAGAFLNRFTAAEQTAIQTAAQSSPAIALGLTMGLASGQIDLTSPVTTNWMAGLVSAGALTHARSTAILTP